MKQSILLTIFLLLVGWQVSQAQKECCYSLSLVNASPTQPIIIGSTSGPGLNVETVENCSCLGGEGGSTWFSFSASNDGTFELLIEPLHPPANFDFAIWEVNCPCQVGPGNPNTPAGPIVCSNFDSGSFTGVAYDPFDTWGVGPAGPLPPGFEPSIWHLTPGRNYFLLVTNVSDDGSGFKLRTGGTASIGPLIPPPSGGDIEGPTELCAGATAQFTVPLTLGANNYAWSVTPNGITQNGPTPYHDLTFPTIGTYEVCVTPSLPPSVSCFAADSSCMTVHVTQLPVPAGYETGYVCLGGEYIAGNGEVFNFGGTYDLHYDSYLHCDSIVRLTLNQKVPDFNLTVKEVCPGECVSWGGQTYCDSGTYDDIQQNQFGCDSINELLLVVVPLETRVNGVDTIDCNTPSITLNSNGSIFSNNAVFTWKRGNTVVGNGQSLTITTGGNYTLSIESAVGDHTCTISKTVTIIQDTNIPQGVTAVGGNATCYTSEVTLMGSSTTANVTYSWTGPNGFTSNLQNPMVSTQGNYILTVTGANGCTKTATAVVSENKVPPAAAAVANGTLNCNAATVQLNGAGSSTGAQFTYLWSTTDGNITMNETTLTPTVNQGGTYVLTVTNQTNGCTSTAAVSVIQLPAVAALITGTTDVNCFGGSSGASTVEASGGDGTYTYAWSNGANTAMVSGLTVGNYTVVVTDGNGCTASQSVTISQPANLVPNATATPQTTFGVDDGTATANPSGGTSSYTYMWSNGETTQTITGLAPGNYTVVVTDSHGCTKQQTVTVSEVACAVTASIEQSDVSCFGAADGSATVTLLNANGTVTYAWSNGENTQTVTGLSGGTFDVSATDEAGCEVVTTVVIDEPQQLNSNATATNLTAFNADDGTASATPTGGSAPYTYAWNNGETTATITDLAPGMYTVVVTDANDCTKQQTVTVSPFNCSFSATITLGEISCNGATDGQATFSPTGGNAPFTYLWSTGETTATITGLGAGTVTGTVIDNDGCPAVVEAILTEPTALGVDVTDMVESHCLANDGSLTVSGTGGTPDYTYLWQTGGETTPTVTGLNAGTYTVAITDANGCSSNFDVVLGTDDIVPPVVVTQNITVQLDANGQVTIQPEDLDGGSTDDCQIASYSLDVSTFDCSNLGDNTISLSVTDMGNNTASATAIVTVEEATPPTIVCPDDILVGGCNAMATFDVTATDNCGGNVDIMQTAGLPSGSNFPLGNSTVTFSATDESGNTSSCSFVVTVQSSMTLTISQVNVACFGDNTGSATANPVGGLPPITYLWSNGDDTQTSAGLTAGTYTVTTTDNGGCTASESVTITQPTNFTTALVSIMNAINNMANGSIDVNVSGGTSPYTYVWKNSAGMVIGNMEDINGLLPGTYTLLATDAHGCQSQSGYTIQNDVATSESALDSHVLLYPNPTLGEVTLELVDLYNYGTVEVTAFDITGRQVLHTVNPSNKQMLDFKTNPSGVYVLKIMIGNDVLTKRLVVSK
ncbi:MAG: T9SS type A sorting domain-containing protein [Bacteroidetes bacterium]|nr:T9SS type A sorting domain-containing protein [Bacteroidota bacterium]